MRINMHKITYNIISVTLILILCSCSGSAPSIAGFMNPKSESFIKKTHKKGDLVKDMPDYDEYYDELSEEIDFGAYFNAENLVTGFEFGSAGLKPVFGIRNDYIGALVWSSFDLSGVAGITYGVAVAEQYSFSSLDSAVRIGIYQYMNKSNIPSFEDGELFRTPVGYKSYFETGIGVYGAVSLLEKYGISIDYKIGRQIHTHQIRKYLELKASYSFHLGGEDII